VFLETIFAIYPSLVLFEQSTCIDLITFLLYTVTDTDQDIAFLVPDSCAVMMRKVTIYVHKIVFSSETLVPL